MLNKVVIIDNYDSFTYNLVHAVEPFTSECKVMRNDEIDYSETDTADILILSPGPGLPATSGKLNEVIEKYIYCKPILGVCLGMQALITYFDQKALINLKQVMHGRSVMITHNKKGLFKNINSPIKAGLYHSWGVKTHSIPDQFEVIAYYNDIAMGVKLKGFPVYGVQFHPESVLTEQGILMIENLLKSAHTYLDLEMEGDGIAAGSKKNG